MLDDAINETAQERNPMPHTIDKLARTMLAIIVMAVSAACANTARHDPIERLRREALPLQNTDDLAPLVNAVGDRRLVLLGEASHGTSEFYTWRTEISRRLIEEKNFRFIAVEGDWATSYRLNRYVKGHAPPGTTARGILRGFTRWPTWMWGNEEVADLIEWLRAHNADRPPHEQVGFYGIDVYGEDTSLRKVLKLLSELSVDLVQPIAENYACLLRYDGDFRRYTQAVARGQPSCESQIRAVLDLLREAEHLHEADPGAYFNLKQNALVVKHAERHYRLSLHGGAASWNSRVDHFYRTTVRLLDHHGKEARGIVWAHNTHIGDASATAMSERGEYNIGQLAREHLGRDQVFSVGFGTHRGTVKAGRSWGATPTVMTVPPAVAGSLEDLLHRTQTPQFILLFAGHEQRFAPLLGRLGHRAIGVVYQPEREHLGNYVDSAVFNRYDAFIYIEETRAVTPVF